MPSGLRTARNTARSSSPRRALSRAWAAPSPPPAPLSADGGGLAEHERLLDAQPWLATARRSVPAGDARDGRRRRHASPRRSRPRSAGRQRTAPPCCAAGAPGRNPPRAIVAVVRKRGSHSTAATAPGGVPAADEEELLDHQSGQYRSRCERKRRRARRNAKRGTAATTVLVSQIAILESQRVVGPSVVRAVSTEYRVSTNAGLAVAGRS